jgi:hypothetical protein
MNVFSSDEFLNAFRCAFFSSEICKIELFVVNSGYTFRALVRGNGKICHSHFLIDFLEPIESEFPLPRVYLKAAYLCRVALKRDAIDHLDLVKDLEPAPFISWKRFSDWNSFEKFVASKGRKNISDINRQLRRIEREIGPVRFESDAQNRDEILFKTMQWKSAKFQRSLHKDIFACPRVQRFMLNLLNTHILKVSSLSAGDVLLATHVGLRWRNRSYYWFPAHNFEFEKYSPGKILLYFLMNRSFEDGDIEFDFLIGGESYKYNYASDVRWVEALGSPSFVEHLQLRFAALAKSMMKSNGSFLSIARKVEIFLDSRNFRKPK